MSHNSDTHNGSQPMRDHATTTLPENAGHRSVTGALTLEQKAALLSGHDFQRTKALVERDIEALVLCDGPHGVRFADTDANAGAESWSTPAEPATCFPPACAVANSWDPAIAQAIGAAIGREARAYGVNVNLGPAVNIKRSPLCGRNFEYWSEDPLLTGALAAEHVGGLQGEGVGASVKHFAANNQETERMRVSADVDERTLREIYLPAFERVVTQAKPATVMAAYNKVNGIHACEHPWLLTTVLREEWGFDGVVVSDWGGVTDRVAALRAGLDLEMPGSGGVNDARVVKAVDDGELDEAVVDRSVERLRALARFATRPTGNFDVESHHGLARRTAAECVVLLKNDAQTLPLSSSARVAVIGQFAAEPRYQGGGSSHVNATRVDAPLDVMRSLNASVGFAPGFKIDGTGDAPSLLAEAVALVQDADVAVVFAGLAERDESEGFDRSSLALPDEQVAVIRAVAAAARRTVVVLSHGGVVTLEGWHDEVDAIVDAFLLGQGGGAALADVLYGVVNPSGRLAETIPLRLQDNPSWLNFPGEEGHARYGEGVLVGYRYYTTAEVPVRYPFGHGLSYTTFTTTGMQARLTGDDTAEVTVAITNTGSRAGKHVVQVYVGSDAGTVRRPIRELRAFAKVALEPGASETVTLTLDRRAFAHWSTQRQRWVVPGGAYRIEVADNATEVIAETTLTLVGDRLPVELSIDSTVEEWFTHPVVTPALLRGLGADDEQAAAEPGDWLAMIGSMSMRQFATFPGVELSLERLNELVLLSSELPDSKAGVAG
jgi:beta-glucosidase